MLPARIEASRGAAMTFTITMMQDEDGVFVTECPAIPGCVSQGRTAEEAEANIRQAIRECLAVRREQGLPPTIDVRQVDVVV
jgi:predicted RNase H-like HicB family nuclease